MALQPNDLLVVSRGGDTYQTTAENLLDGSVEEAPNDGKQYGRQNETWTEITGGGGSVDLSNYVTLDGDETITGVKTFEPGLITNTISSSDKADPDSQISLNEDSPAAINVTFNKTKDGGNQSQGLFIGYNDDTTVHLKRYINVNSQIQEQATATEDVIHFECGGSAQNTTGKVVGFQSSINTTSNTGGDAYAFYASGTAPAYFRADVIADGSFIGNLTGTATTATNANRIKRAGKPKTDTASYRLLLGPNSNTAGYGDCYVITDRTSCYYTPNSDKLTVGTVDANLISSKVGSAYKGIGWNSVGMICMTSSSYQPLLGPGQAQSGASLLPACADGSKYGSTPLPGTWRCQGMQVANSGTFKENQTTNHIRTA